MANNILFSDITSSLQHGEFVAINENKENGEEGNSILEHDVSNASLDENKALGTKYENGQNIMAVSENKKHSYKSDVSSINCDMCGKYFKSISLLRDHHFICMKDKQIEYTDCDKPFSYNDAFKIHMCKHLCLNGSPGKHCNLISETNVYSHEKFDCFVSIKHVEVDENVGGGDSVTDRDVLLSGNVSNRNKVLELGIDMQSSTIKNFIDCRSEKKSTGDASSESEVMHDTCNDLEVVLDMRDNEFESPANLVDDCCTESNVKQCISSESDGQPSFSESLNRRKKQGKHHRIQKKIIHSITESEMRKSVIQSKFKNSCTSNDGKSVCDKSSVTEPFVSEFTCDICDSKFTSLSDLKTHCHTHTNHKLYDCPDCGKQFSGIDTFKRHVGIHKRKKQEQYTCKICLQSFPLEVRLNVHLRIHTNAREFRCTLCEKGFNQKSTLKSHMLTHSGEKRHKCSICDKSFGMKSSLTRHLQRHSGDRPHQCDVCFYKFFSVTQLTQHYRKHTGERPFVCDICQKRFRRRSGLNIHVAAHTGNQPHECDVCKRKFFHKSALIWHNHHAHIKDKPYVCTICDKSFKSNAGLKQHLQIHTGEKPFVCTYCSKGFANREVLDRHILIHTGIKPYECKICKRLFNQKTSLQRHQVVHTKEKPYSCDICKKCFTQKSYLSTHKLTHNKKKA